MDSMKEEQINIQFTEAELWMLHAFVRHDRDRTNRDRYPIVSTELNRQIVLALLACSNSDIKEYNLLFSEANLLLLDWCIRDDMKSPAGANGKEILLKVFQARSDLIYGPTSKHQDIDYKTAISRKAIREVEEEDHAKPDNGTDESPDDHPFAYA
ncbi:hypothetical protein LCGC14_2584050 [marine sediment metagenome]|uniref:Uncharacterized protein n=1 Tax=marine sediment metagenome TaxID=412755 RepID=A0A0F9D6B6_9ZZZZ